MAGTGPEYGCQNPAVKVVTGYWRHEPTTHHRFADVDAIMEVACQESSRWRARQSRSNDATQGTRTWAEAVDLARGGWAAGRQSLVRNIGIEAATLASPVQTWTYDYAGAYPDVPRFLGGDLDCMVDHRMERVAQRPIIRLAVSPVTSSDIGAHAVACWGAALVSWIDELEQTGHRVEVTWLSCSEPYWVSDAEIARMVASSRFALSFCLKAADQPVDLDRLAFWLMHVAAQRRIQFAVKEQYDIERAFHTHYGNPVQDVAVLAPLCSPDAVILCVGRGAASVTAGLTWLREQSDGWFAKRNAAA